MCRATISSQSAARTVEPPVQTALSETRMTARFRVRCMAARPLFTIVLTSHPFPARATRSKTRGLHPGPCPPTLARVVASTQDHPGRSAADLSRWNDAPPCLARRPCDDRPRARVRPAQRAHGHHCSRAPTRYATAASIRSRSCSLIEVLPLDPPEAEPAPVPAPMPVEITPHPLLEWCAQAANSKTPLCRNVGSSRVQR